MTAPNATRLSDSAGRVIELDSDRLRRLLVIAGADAHALDNDRAYLALAVQRLSFAFLLGLDDSLRELEEHYTRDQIIGELDRWAPIGKRTRVQRDRDGELTSTTVESAYAGLTDAEVVDKLLTIHFRRKHGLMIPAPQAMPGAAAAASPRRIGFGPWH